MIFQAHTPSAERHAGRYRAGFTTTAERANQTHQWAQATSISWEENADGHRITSTLTPRHQTNSTTPTTRIYRKRWVFCRAIHLCILIEELRPSSRLWRISHPFSASNLLCPWLSLEMFKFLLIFLKGRFEPTAVVGIINWFCLVFYDLHAWMIDYFCWISF